MAYYKIEAWVESDSNILSDEVQAVQDGIESLDVGIYVRDLAIYEIAW